jgi:transcriptional antiterminator NusG
MPDEVDRILTSMGMSRIDIANDLAEGKKVKITAGPFNNMIGKISSYDLENKKVEVLLDLFGQETSVEVSLSEIENLK